MSKREVSSKLFEKQHYTDQKSIKELFSDIEYKAKGFYLNPE